MARAQVKSAPKKKSKMKTVAPKTAHALRAVTKKGAKAMVKKAMPVAKSVAKKTMAATKAVTLKAKAAAKSITAATAKVMAPAPEPVMAQPPADRPAGNSLFNRRTMKKAKAAREAAPVLKPQAKPLNAKPVEIPPWKGTEGRPAPTPASVALRSRPNVKKGDYRGIMF